MPTESERKLADEFLDAWNSQDTRRVLACYTHDCVYRDPNTRGAVIGQEAMSRYLAKLFRNWKMTWALREYLPLRGTDGGALLWKASIAPASGGAAQDIDGMDLVLLRDGKLARNEVYFDRTALFPVSGE